MSAFRVNSGLVSILCGSLLDVCFLLPLIVKIFKVNINSSDTVVTHYFAVRSKKNLALPNKNSQKSFKNEVAILSCPKCHSPKNVLCLAGGIVLTQTQQWPLYCMSCKLNFIAKKKKEIKAESEPLSFEFIIIDPKPLITQNSKVRSNYSKRFEPKRHIS